MKKILIGIICIFSFFSLAACSKNTTTKETKETEKIEILESDFENQMNSIAEYLNRATFVVLNYNSSESENASSLGSGVIYKKVVNENNTYTYYLVTNRHVIEDGEKFKVYSSEGATTSANVLGVSVNHDIGVLTFISYVEYNVVPFASFDNVKQGDYCFAMGTPLYIQYLNTFTKGNVSGIRNEYVQHTADINSGNSGGPLVNLNGEIIGINVSKLSNNTTNVDIDGMCLAIRSDLVLEAIDEIEGKNDAVINPLLGMTVTDVSDILAYNYETFDAFWNELKNDFISYYVSKGYSIEFATAKFNESYGSKKNDYEANYNNLHAFNVYIPTGLTSGMMIREVVSNSASDKAGLKIGDIVVKINDIEVTNQTTFSKEFYKYKVGDSFTITVNRANELVQKTITL
ncbi:MAG: trypsin-like peptidase domain-containing protein [bacterium]|nr:trypsin-like peptidase domain-containing protein [bacterium]